ncbi:MAG: response regulator [Acidobacteriaceae bacterium]
MMTYANEEPGPRANASILLASDSERHGSSIHQLLKEEGFAIDYVGDYSRIDPEIHAKEFDVVLLDVTGEHAVELAVETALRLKRANASQFVGYVADANLEASGLAGDAVFPRNAARLREALRRLLAEGELD